MNKSHTDNDDSQGEKLDKPSVNILEDGLQLSPFSHNPTYLVLISVWMPVENQRGVECFKQWCWPEPCQQVAAPLELAGRCQISKGTFTENCQLRIRICTRSNLNEQLHMKLSRTGTVLYHCDICGGLITPDVIYWHGIHVIFPTKQTVLPINLHPMAILTSLLKGRSLLEVDIRKDG